MVHDSPGTASRHTPPQNGVHAAHDYATVGCTQALQNRGIAMKGQVGDRWGKSCCSSCQIHLDVDAVSRCRVLSSARMKVDVDFVA